MAYKPPSAKRMDYDNKSGLAKVMLKGNKVGVMFLEDEQERFVFSKSDCPENIRDGEWLVSLSNGNKGIWNFNPYQGVFKGKVQRFVSKEGEQPTYKEREISYTRGGKLMRFTVKEFTVILEALEPKKYTGITSPYTLPYNLVPLKDDDGNEVMGYKPPPEDSKYSAKLHEFFLVAGAWDKGPMKALDNSLPAFEKRILREEKVFQYQVEKGYAVKVFPAFSEGDEEPNITTTPTPDFEPVEEDLPWEENSEE